MGRWALGFEVAEKSFAIVRKNRNALLYVLITAIAVSAIAFGFLFFKRTILMAFMDRVPKEVGRAFLQILAIPLIYITHTIVTHRKTHINAWIIFWLMVWIFLSVSAMALLHHYIPKNEDVWFSLHSVLKALWAVLTYYVLIAIPIAEVNPLLALYDSIKALRQTYVEAIALEISFLVIGGILGVPFIGSYLILNAFYPESALIAVLLAAFILPLAVIFLLVKFVGCTLLYLYYKKEIPASYFEK